MSWGLVRNYAMPILILAIILIFMFLNFRDSFLNKSDDTGGFDEIVFAEEKEVKESENNEENLIIVDIKGEIKNPGIYTVDLNDRVNDVIKKAGGFTNEADESQINLAQRVFDEMVIFVPSINPSREDEQLGNLSSDKIRINYATQEEIEQLKGIGPSKASSIIQYREENGPFQSVEDLLNVTGIGEKTLENIKEDIQVP